MICVSIAPMFDDGTDASPDTKSVDKIEDGFDFIRSETEKWTSGEYTKLADDGTVCVGLDITISQAI
jgi:hypothetical protein